MLKSINFTFQSLAGTQFKNWRCLSMYYSRKIKELISLFESKFEIKPTLILKIRNRKNLPYILLISQKPPKKIGRAIVKQQEEEPVNLKKFDLDVYTELKELLRRRFDLKLNNFYILVCIQANDFDCANMIFNGIQMIVFKLNISKTRQNAKHFAKILRDNFIEIETSIYKPNPTP